MKIIIKMGMIITTNRKIIMYNFYYDIYLLKIRTVEQQAVQRKDFVLLFFLHEV